MERLLASSNVRMPAQKLRSRILSFENVKGNDDQLRHSIFWIVCRPVGSSLESVGY